MNKPFFLSAVFIAQICTATVRVTMFSTPVVLADSTGSTATQTYAIDVDNNGLDDVQFKLFTFGDNEITFESLNGQNFEAEVVNDYEGIAYNCGASYGATNDWYEPAYLAEESDDYQFDNKGPRYLAVRKRIGDPPYETYIYGWGKIECSADAHRLTIYGYAFEDVPDFNPSIFAGKGECMLNTGIDAPLAPVRIISLSQNRLSVSSQESHTLEVFDISGQLLLRRKSSAGVNEYDLPFTSNILLVKLDTGNRVSVFKLFNPL